MDDSSTRKRLVGVATEEDACEEVRDLSEVETQRSNQRLSGGEAAAAAPTTTQTPPPKGHKSGSGSSSKASKSKSKSKIPRSPSLASTLYNNNNTSSSGNFLAPKFLNGGGPLNATPLVDCPDGPPPTLLSPTDARNLNGSHAMGGGVQLNTTSNANGNNNNNNNNSNSNGSTAAAQRSASVSVNSARRPQIQVSPIAESPKHFQYLTLTVRKDENGYGMKVSGDNPVFVESVKPGGAAQVAGLVAGDMILKVNGQEVRSEKHPTVVSLIKASTIVELAVKRSHKLIRPSSVGIVPTTPILSGRDRTASITGPQPVDSIKRREMETYKIQTLQKMLEQEKLNLERLKGETNNPSYKLSEANIRKLREQLRQIGVEDAPAGKYQAAAAANNNHNNKHNLSSAPSSSHHPHLFTPPTLQTHQHQHQQHFHHHASPQPPPAAAHSSSPAFLSLLPRSLSSLSLGTRKNKIDKELISTPLNNTTDFLHTHGHAHHLNHLGSPTPTQTQTPPLPAGLGSPATTTMSQSLHQPHPSSGAGHAHAHGHPYRSSAQQMLFQHHHQQQQQRALRETPKAKGKQQQQQHKFGAAGEDVPPPLPQRNPPRPPPPIDPDSSAGPFVAPVSDLDSSLAHSPQPQPHQQAAAVLSLAPAPTPSPAPPSAHQQQQQKKRSKAKAKALSDPKVSTQLFLQMEALELASPAEAEGECDAEAEADAIPPPLPPRQPGMLEEAGHRSSFSNLSGNNNSTTNSSGRPPPNSIDTLLSYPLVATCTPVHRDNMAAAFPLSQRPNIVQQLQQHQQHQQQQQHHHHEASFGPPATGGAFAAHESKHRRTVSSPENMHPKHPGRISKSTSGTWELVEKDGEGTPPGTPPPPYLTAHQHHHQHQHQHQHNSSTPVGEAAQEAATTPVGGGIFVDSHQFTPLAGPLEAQEAGGVLLVNRLQKEIISMEDEDASDVEGPFIDENGPFNYLQRLLEVENVAFLAVFLNYVLSNSEPAPLLFYLITGLYKEGTAKDMRKWAYEIHSTFLVPRAPLSWYRQDESLAREVDNVLQSEFDKVEILRKVFWKSRKRARDIICEQLREFQQKRTAGLGTIYGPTDAQLTDAKGDKQREQHIFEETLLRKLQILIEEYEKELPLEDPKKLALCSALSTVIHRIFITRSHPNSIVDRVHHFVSREKSFKSRLMGKNRKMVVRGHPLVLRQYYEVTHCNHCQTIIWGVSPQGYHCTDCKLNIHRPCSKVLEENCPGPLPQAKRKDKDPHNDNKISKFMEKIRPRTSSDFIAMEKRARIEEDLDSTELSNERVQAAVVRQPSDRRPDKAGLALRSNGSAAGELGAGGAGTPVGGEAGAAGACELVGASGAQAGALPAGGVAPSGPGGAAGQAAAGGGAGGGGADVSALELIEHSKDVRREILQQQHHQQLQQHQHQQQQQQNKSAPVSVNRSESYKERLSHKRSRNSRRKTSDPSLTSRQNDDQPDVGLSNSNFTASSNSSLSSGGGSESPSTSMEQVGAAPASAAAGLQQAHAHTPQPQSHHHHHHMHHSHSHSHSHGHHDSFHGSIGSGSGSGSTNTSFWGSSSGPTPTSAGAGAGAQLTRQWNFDSDDDDDLNEADWSSNVAAEMLAALTDAEKKRQEIINEIYQTERSHVRTLKLLDRLFFCPLQESGVLSNDHLTLLFPPALIALRELHAAFEQQLKQRRLEHNHIVSHVGDLLVSMFEGQTGEELRELAAQFCARQQIALEALKEKRRKDEQLQKLLSKAEAHKACRRLQLKDLLPTVLQRLTKYPLLFENLYKVTIRVVPENIDEAEAIQRALESSKKILVDVNQAVKTAEDAHKLQNIQRKLDKSTFDKEEFKNLDLTQYRLIHDGSLTMKKNPSIQLHGLLFENMIVLLTKQDDKYSLKYLQAARNTEVNNKPVNPIMSIDSETLVRQEAADKNSFFLIKTKTSQMLELRAPSSSECKTWFKHISDAAEQYKPRSKNASHEPVDDPAIATLPHSSTKESLELTPERPPPLAATATVSTTPLAPMMPPATATSASTAFHAGSEGVPQIQVRGERREAAEGVKLRANGTPAGPAASASYSNNNTSNGNGNGNELLPGPAVSRTMSTRSCGEAQSGYSNEPVGGVTLRHTQSARKANEGAPDEPHLGSSASSCSAAGSTAAGAGMGGMGGLGGAASKRDSASIVYSNNSNNTRTFIQSYLPLVDPTAIRISISPAHTAEPVLTPAEKLRRLDAAIRDGLLEKQKIICDMFRLPVEHFHEIVDIAAMPEAPKDSADIALAAYAQVQSLTEVINEYMQVSAEQEISAVSTTICDQCHDKQRSTPLSGGSSSNSMTTQISASQPPPPPPQSQSQSPPPPPLPPPNRTMNGAMASNGIAPKAAHSSTLDEVASIIEDDDGYCEIDELRLPAIPSSSFKPPAPLPQSAEQGVTPTQSSPTATAAAAAVPVGAAGLPAELVKRQSTLSADSIPEETLGELIADSREEHEPTAHADPEPQPQPQPEVERQSEDETEVKAEPQPALADEQEHESEPETEPEAVSEATESQKTEGGSSKSQEAEEPEPDLDSEQQSPKIEEPHAREDVADAADAAEHMEINETYDSVSLPSRTMDTATQTLPLPLSLPLALPLRQAAALNLSSLTPSPPSVASCGPNRIQHASALEPSIPCSALSSIVGALNAQISLLLPKINDRDMERERLRKENQHLRELLNAMHERQRVEAKLETPTEARASGDDDSAEESTTARTATPTPTTTTTATSAESPSSVAPLAPEDN